MKESESERERERECVIELTVSVVCVRGAQEVPGEGVYLCPVSEDSVQEGTGVEERQPLHTRVGSEEVRRERVEGVEERASDSLREGGRGGRGYGGRDGGRGIVESTSRDSQWECLTQLDRHC